MAAPAATPPGGGVGKLAPGSVKNVWDQVVGWVAGIRGAIRRDVNRLMALRLGAIAIVYAALVAGALVCNEKFRLQGTRAYLATKPLPRNHFLAAADLRRPPSFAGDLGFYLVSRDRLEGQYVRTFVDAGAPVTPENVQPEPDLTVDPCFELVSLPINNGAPFDGLLDPGMTLRLSGRNPESKDRVAVEACVVASIHISGTGPCSALAVAVPRGAGEVVRRINDTLEWTLEGARPCTTPPRCD
jgi:hypothetical protein